MRLSGVLEVDLTGAVDEFGYFTGRDAAALMPEVPTGVTVELQIGSAVPLDGLLGPLAELLRPAGEVVVRGTRAAGVGAVYQALAVAFRSMSGGAA